MAAALGQLWEVGARMCGKLLASVVPELLATLERHGELRVSSEVRALLLSISPSSIDRLLRRPRTVPKHKAPAAATLKGEVPIRTWSEWRGVEPGSLQADLIFHCGESGEGFFLTTLCAMDVATGWTEMQPVWGMGKQHVGRACHLLRQHLPFPLKALPTDNGAEFINHVLVPWCRREKIAFTRGRGYRKNDQAYVEQRNWLAVQRRVGYPPQADYSSRAALGALQRLYALLRLQSNFFRPLRKLVRRKRVGAKAVKYYDTPRTP